MDVLKRYAEIKVEHPNCILAFRVGDFYEFFYEDAKLVSKVVGLTLTTRNKSSDQPIPMAGFPYHSLEGYLKKLITAGHRVAVCDPK